MKGKKIDINPYCHHPEVCVPDKGQVVSDPPSGMLCSFISSVLKGQSVKEFLSVPSVNFSVLCMFRKCPRFAKEWMKEYEEKNYMRKVGFLRNMSNKSCSSVLRKLFIQMAGVLLFCF